MIRSARFAFMILVALGVAPRVPAVVPPGVSVPRGSERAKDERVVPKWTVLPSTPEELLSRMSAAVQAKDFRGLFALWDPIDLEDFKKFFVEIARATESRGMAGEIQDGFGVKSSAELERLPASELLARVFEKLAAQQPAFMSGFLGSSTIAVIGWVPEGPTVRHIVVRMRAGDSADDFQVVAVQSVRDTGSGWVALPSANIKGLLAVAKRAAQQGQLRSVPPPVAPDRGLLDEQFSREGADAVPLGPDMTPPERILKVDPVYPEAARRAHEEGKVVLEAVIERDGRIAAVKVLKGSDALWPAAVDAVRGWRYKPAERDGKPVKIVFTILVEFTLERGPRAPSGAKESVPEDKAQEVERLRKAAEGGVAAAQVGLGFALANGRGVPQDDAQAIEWYRKAAEQGDADGQFYLGWMYAKGSGVPQDDAQAVMWYRKAAEQGHALAEANLGAKYAEGHGVPKDEVQAVAWYRKAAASEVAAAQYNLGVMYGEGRGVAKDDAEAVAWYRKAAEQSFAPAQVNLGTMYAEGRGVPKDDVQAAAWFREAAERGLANAQFALGTMYAEGRGVTKDDAQAEEWYRKAAEQGHAQAEEALARMSKGERRER